MTSGGERVPPQRETPPISPASPEEPGAAIVARKLASEETADRPPGVGPLALPTAVVPGSVAAAPSSWTPPLGARLRSVSARSPAPYAADAELVAAVQRGDRRAAAGLYDRLLRVLESTLRRVLGGAGPDHEDLLQTVFEDVLVGLYRGQFRGECSLTSWAASIACHRALNVIRSRKTARKYLHQDGEAALDQAPASTDVERTVANRQNLERVRAAMAGLGAGQAETVLMHEVLGYSLAEVAAATGTTVAAAQSRLVRGKKELEARLGAVREGVR